MRPASTSLRPRAAGHVLSTVLVILLIASTYALYRPLNAAREEKSRRERLLAALTFARDTLIAYAATDPKRPGRLLCPDIVGNGISPLLTGDDCPGYVGWLPWKTLDLSGDGDDRGQIFHYVVSPLFGGDRNSPPLNSDTATTLSLDKTAAPPDNGIAGLLIASRGPLDSRNADHDDRFFNGKSSASDDNDVVVAITREQLMAATELRIANQLRSCLQAHAEDPQNTEQTYPWPAPLEKTGFQGTSGSFFGRFPETQAGNPEASLQSAIIRIDVGKSLLETAASAAAQRQVLQDLQQQAVLLRLQFDRLYRVALNVDSRAQLAKSSLVTLDNRLTNTTAAADTLSAIEAGTANLAAFIEAIQDSGFDFFEQALATLNGTLKLKIDNASSAPGNATLDKLATAIKDLKALLLNGWTPNPGIQGQIEGNRSLAVNAESLATEAKSNTVLNATALAMAQALFDANLRLSSDLQGGRVNLDPGEIRYRAERINNLASALITKGSAAGTSDLNRTLRSTRTLLKQISNPPDMVQKTLSALDSAIASQVAAGADTFADSCQTVSRQLFQVADWLEQVGDNVALETLRAVQQTLLAANRRQAFTSSDASMLRAAVGTAIYWTRIASEQAADIARAARRSLSAKNDSDASAYTAANRFLDSLDGTSGSLALLEKFDKTPSSTNRDNANKALATSQARLAELIEAAKRLDLTFSAGQAKAALPVAWLGSACTFMQASSSVASWWATQGWQSLFFYQISDRIRPDIGALTINGQGSHPFIVISSGQALPKQQNRNSPLEIGQFLEARNADTSRNGLAQAPDRHFSRQSLTPNFNDQLAY